jgi:hypothetical protein
MQIVIAVNEMDSKTMKTENSARYPAGYVSPHSTLHVLRVERYQRPWHSRHSRHCRQNDINDLGILVTLVTVVTLVTLVTLVTAFTRSKHCIGTVVTMMASLPLRPVSMGCNGASCVREPDHSKLSYL